MKGKRWGKRLLAGVILLLAAVVLLVATYAYWLPWAARPIAKRFGVTFGKYERLANGRIVLTDIVRTNRAFDLRISRLEAFLPHVWRSKLKETNDLAFAEVNGWRVAIHDKTQKENDDPSKASVDRGIYEEWQRAERYIAQARELLPKATLLNGAVEHRGKEYTFSVVTWDKGVLDASGVWPETAVPFEIKGKLTGDLPYQLSYAMTPLDLRTRLRVMETNGLLNARLATFYKENRADLEANFSPGGRLPASATLKAPGFKLPADLLKLEKYSEITGSLNAEWKTNAYTVELTAHAEPLVSAGEMPAGDIEISARGDTNSVFIERAVSTIPGLKVSVNAPLELSYKGKMLSERSELQLDADLEKLPWLKVKGRIKGTILLEQGAEFPKATFQAGGTNVTARGISAEVITAAGDFDWPRVENFKLESRFGTNGSFSISGGADLKSRIADKTVVHIDGAFLTLADFLPDAFHFGAIRVNAQLSGPITNLQHAGEFELRDFVAPALNPLTIEASWKAEQITFDRFAMRARAGPAAIYVSGSGYAGGGRTNLVLRELNFLRGDDVYLQLAEAARLTVTTNYEVEVEPLTFLSPQASPPRQMHLSFGIKPGDVIALEFGATNINPALFQGFTTRSLSGLDLEHFNLLAAWSNGPVTGVLNGRFSVQEKNFERLTASIDLELANTGLLVRKLSISNPESEICRANGVLPVIISPTDLEKIRVIPNQEINFEAATVPNAAFWETVSKLTKVEVTNAAVQIAINGSPRRPRGELRVAATGIKYAQTNLNLPPIGRFEGVVTLDEQSLRVPQLSLDVAGQAVEIDGQLQLTDDFWTQRREEIVQYAVDHARVRVQAADVQLAPFTEYLPKHLRAQGTLVADVTMHPGKDFSGAVQIRDVETRPLPKIGVVQQIQADIMLKGKEVHIENLSGVFGGERLSLGGRVDLSAESVAKGYPDLDLAIKGFNVPLARNPDVILRSDLDLRVTNSVNRIPVVSGTANLRDSYLLRDISTLVPGRVARPDRRPPYFSMPQDPIDEWLLDVRVRGENFMRVRSPFFQGVASANFHVTGTMAEPIALGEAAVSSGLIVFPFATLVVRQGLVSITSENPYLPSIFVVASGRAFGFDVRMEAEGPADEPVIEFSSVPSLTSEQIVLMLTTGQIPRDDFGFSNEDRASRLAFFLGKSLWSKLNPGKPAEEKLTIRSGQDVTEQGKQTYEVEYKLNERWSLVGEYNRFGDLNGNVKWKVFSR